MTHAATEAIECEGWRLQIADAGLTSGLREAAVARALEAARGALGAPKRRSRHASTWHLRIAAGVDLEIFIKLLDAPRGLDALKGLVRGGRVDHVARITQALNDAGFAAPPLLAYGRELASGREIMVTPQAEAEGPLRALKSLRAYPVDRKRAVLRALGAEIARLHRCGFVHGDLTPYNIFVTGVAPPQFVFIDHDRTRRTILSRFERPRLRNLVQLGHLDLKTITNTDRMRVWCGYSATMPTRRRRSSRRRVTEMLRTRIARERSLAQSAHGVVPARIEVREG